MNQLKFILKHSKYIIPTLTFISLCRLVLLYYLFDIKIGYFLSLDEVLTPFISDALVYLLFFVIPVITLSVFINDTIGKANVQDYVAQKELPFKVRFLNDLKANWVLLIIYTFSTVILIIKKEPLEFILGTITFLPVLNFIFWIRKEVMIKHNFVPSSNNNTLYNLSTLLIAIFILTISRTFFEADQIKYGNNPVVQIQLPNETIVCKDSISYIGKTKSYTFIYYKKQRNTVVLVNSSISKVIFSP